MGLGASFWSGSGDEILWDHDFTNLVDGNTYAAYQGWIPFALGPCKMYQEPSMLGGAAASRIQNNPGFDTGYFYGQETTSGEIIWCDNVVLLGSAHYVTPASQWIGTGQWVKLLPNFKVNDLLPIDATTGEDSTKYKTGFLDDIGNCPNFDAPGLYEAMVFFHAQSKTGTWQLRHYAPYAWAGTPPALVAAVAMKAGVGSTFIEQDGFDDAHDAYAYPTGDAPWKDLDYTPWTLHLRREVGKTVAETILEVCRHTRDLVYVNEEGKLACSSWTRPTYDLSSLALSDGVLGTPEWEITNKYLMNAVRATWGAAARQAAVQGSQTPPPSSTNDAAFEPHLESYGGDKWAHEEEDAASRTAYGTYWLRGQKSLVNFKGHPQEVEIAHYPLLLSSHAVAAGGVFDWDETDGGGVLPVTYWLTSDAKPRKEIRLRQSPLGWDFGVGDLISDLDVTCDGETVGEARCIEKAYDWDNLTCESLLLEIPSNS